MSYEEMNSAGYLRSRMIVVLNDNGKVSLPTGTQSAGVVVSICKFHTNNSIIFSQETQIASRTMSPFLHL